MADEETVMIDVRQLQVGMYVFIDLGWMDHPFPLNRFKIKSEDQIRIIRTLGIRKIRYSPANSDVPPLSVAPEGAMPTPAVPENSTASPQIEAMLLEKKIRRKQLEEYRERISKCKKIVSDAAQLMRQVNADIFSKPQFCIEAVGKTIDIFLESLMSNEETALLSINDTHAGDEIYNHSVNVAVLSVMMAKELNFSLPMIKLIGVGSLFHDIGKLEIPSKVTLKTDPLTKTEVALLQEHTNYGEKIARTAKLDPEVIAIVSQHHELIDGTGYPRKLKADSISPLAQLVAIINLYDNLCNPVNAVDALTPHEALSKLFALYRTRLNEKMLQAFIRFMGVYPPGSIVGLSNSVIGMVVSVSSGKALKPTLLVYDPDINKEEATLINLDELPGVNISKAIRPSLLAPEVLAYLSPRKRVTYFFDTAKS